MRWLLSTAIALALSGTASANDWEKFYTSFGPTDGFIPAAGTPEVIPSSGNIDQDLENMWRRGYTAIGYTSFSTGNSKTGDATKLAKKLKARYLIVATQLTSSETRSVPITLPNTTTSYTSGTANAYGSGGYATGNYSGTTTTTGSKTTYIPMTVNRFDKLAVYFMEVPKYGAGILPRELTAEEMRTLETRHAFVVRFVRDGSPAYKADLLPGDVVVKVNDKPADFDNWQEAIRSTAPLKVGLLRNGQPRELELTIPDDWRPH